MTALMALIFIVAFLALLGPLSALAARRLPDLPAATVAAGGVGLVALGWLALWPALPLSLAASGGSVDGLLSPFQLTVSGAGSWPLSGAVLLLALAGLLRLPADRDQAVRQAGAILAILPPLLFTLWSDLSGLPLLALAWSVVLAALAPAPGRLRQALLLSLAGFFPLWIGIRLDGPAWLPLLGAAWYLSAFALYRRYGPATPLPPAVAPLLAATLPAVGLAALIALPGSPPAPTLWITAAALIGLLWGIVEGWRHGRADAPRAVAALTVGLAGLLLLGWQWGGAAVVRADGIVLLLAPGALLLNSAADGAGPGRWLQRLPALPAGLALAGLPLLSGRAALYDTLLREGQLLLPAVLALLHIPLTAIAAQLVLQGAPAGLSAGRRGWLPAAVLLPGLLLFAGPAARTTAAMGIVLAVLPPAIGILTALRLDDARQARSEAALNAATARLHALDGPGRAGRRALESVGRALREAALLLEGEGGLLWLLFLLVIFGLARL